MRDARRARLKPTREERAVRLTSNGKARNPAGRPRSGAAGAAAEVDTAFRETARALVKIVREPALLVDAALVVHAANAPFLEAWGLRPDEVLGKPLGFADGPLASQQVR